MTGCYTGWFVQIQNVHSIFNWCNLLIFFRFFQFSTKKLCPGPTSAHHKRKNRWAPSRSTKIIHTLHRQSPKTSCLFSQGFLLLCHGTGAKSPKENSKGYRNLLLAFCLGSATVFLDLNPNSCKIVTTKYLRVKKRRLNHQM